MYEYIILNTFKVPFILVGFSVYTTVLEITLEIRSYYSLPKQNRQ